MAACTLGKLAHAEGAAATARAFCQAMAELEHWEAQEAAAYARQRRKGAASQAASRGTLGGAAPAADAGDLGRERQRREGVAPAPADLGSATGRAAASIFGAVSGTVSGLLSAGPRDAVFSGMFPQSSRLGRLDGATIQKPVLHRGPRGEVIYEWLAPGAPVSAPALPKAAMRWRGVVCVWRSYVRAVLLAGAQTRRALAHGWLVISGRRMERISAWRLPGQRLATRAWRLTVEWPCLTRTRARWPSSWQRTPVCRDSFLPRLSVPSLCRQPGRPWRLPPEMWVAGTACSEPLVGLPLRMRDRSCGFSLRAVGSPVARAGFAADGWRDVLALGHGAPAMRQSRQISPPLRIRAPHTLPSHSAMAAAASADAAKPSPIEALVSWPFLPGSGRERGRRVRFSGR